MLTMSVVQDSNEPERLHFSSNAMRTAGRIGACVIDISPYYCSLERGKVESFKR